MKTKAQTQIEYIDPLTNRSLKEGMRITLTSDNGIIADFTIEAINKDNSLVLTPILSTKVKSSLTPLKLGDSVVILAFLPLGKAKLKANDPVIVQTKDGRKQKYWVDFSLRGDYIFLRPTEKPGKLGLLHRLSLIRRSLSK
jgi:hypothetical protein